MADRVDMLVSRHEVVFEQPDLLCISLRGNVSPEDADALIMADAGVHERIGYALVLIDATQLDKIEADTRKRAARLMRAGTTYHGSIAIFGVNAQMRILIGLFLNGLELFRKQRYTLRFFQEESAARAWLERCRTKLAAGASISGERPLSSPREP